MRKTIYRVTFSYNDNTEEVIEVPFRVGESMLGAAMIGAFFTKFCCAVRFDAKIEDGMGGWVEQFIAAYTDSMFTDSENMVA